MAYSGVSPLPHEDRLHSVGRGWNKIEVTPLTVTVRSTTMPFCILRSHGMEQSDICSAQQFLLLVNTLPGAHRRSHELQWVQVHAPPG